LTIVLLSCDPIAEAVQTKADCYRTSSKHHFKALRLF